MITTAILLIMAIAGLPTAPQTPEITVSAKSYPGWIGPSWDFDLKEGKGRVRVYDGTSEERRVISVSPSRLRVFVATLEDEAFFDLGGSARSDCIDCGGCSLVVKLGDREKRITLGEYRDDGSFPADRAAFDRARRVFEAVKRMAGIEAARDQCQARAVEQ